jgi:hypothetical protein
MNTRNALMKILSFAAIISSVLLIIGWMLGAESLSITPDSVTSGGWEEDSSRLNMITASSSLEDDMDAYLDSSVSAPNPNDFNDSYSDFNR